LAGVVKEKKWIAGPERVLYLLYAWGDVSTFRATFVGAL